MYILLRYTFRRPNAHTFTQERHTCKNPHITHTRVSIYYSMNRKAGSHIGIRSSPYIYTHTEARGELGREDSDSHTILHGCSISESVSDGVCASKPASSTKWNKSARDFSTANHKSKSEYSEFWLIRLSVG